jgi:pimeloyl-ACP methyl ester carboxylesterase
VGEGPPREAWSEWGGAGPPLVFTHANGFPPDTYRLLFGGLSSRFCVDAFAARPLWPGSDPSGIDAWSDLAGDLRLSMRERDLRSLFRALALIDPVVFTGVHALFWGGLKNLGFSHRLPLIRSARRRRDRFPSLDAVRKAYAGKSVFSTWQDEVLDDYVTAAFGAADSGGVELRYSKAWESRIFELTPASVWRSLCSLDLPMLFIRGASSDTFLVSAANRVRRVLPSATVVEIPDTTHFLPMERPEAVAGAIVDWFSGAAGDA